MPDIVTHYRYGNDVFEKLPKPIQNSIQRNVYDLATLGPDSWFFHGFWSAKVRSEKPMRGNRLHEEKTGLYLRRILEECKNAQGEEHKVLFSYFCGYLCHYTLDQFAHPYIIYRTGNYRKTPETLCYRGNHMFMERAIDRDTMRDWPEGGRRPILKYILTLKHLPACVQPSFDRLHREVYGWDLAFRDMNRCIRFQRIFYFFVQDRHGVLRRLLKLFDNGKSSHDLSSLSYAYKLRDDLDVMNRQHKPWKHPHKPDVISEDSFPDLKEKALHQALPMLDAAWDYLENGSPKVFELIGNRSYSSGLDFDDPDNHKTSLVYDALPLKTPPPKASK